MSIAFILLCLHFVHLNIKIGTIFIRIRSNQCRFPNQSNSVDDLFDDFDNFERIDFEFKSEMSESENCDRSSDKESDVSDTHSCASENEENSSILLPPSKLTAKKKNNENIFFE